MVSCLPTLETELSNILQDIKENKLSKGNIKYIDASTSLLKKQTKQIQSLLNDITIQLQIVNRGE